MMRRFGRSLFLLLCGMLIVLCFSPAVHAETTAGINSSYISEQLEKSGANDLPDRLPEEAAESLEEIGVNGIDIESIGNVSAGDILSGILNSFTAKIPTILNAFLSIIGIMMLSALVNSMKLSLGETPVGGVINLVGMLCVVGVVITPVVSCISEAASVIRGGAYFMLGCIPILVGFLIASGQATAGASFSAILMTACNCISFAASHFIVPVLNILLGFSVISSISPNLNLNGISKSFFSILKWILGFGMTIFSGLLTMQGLLGGAVDVTTNKTVKFVVSSFVPIVGNALGEAFGTVQSCAKVLKSGVGAFGILAIIFIFLPILIQCVLWLIALSLSSGIGDIFELKEITSLLRSISKVISMLVAILLCCIALLIVSLEIVMMTGGNSL